MKILVATNLLQAACLLVLLVIVFDDKPSTALEASTPAAVITHQAADRTGPAAIDETRLRQIIREEFDAHTESDSYGARDVAARQRSAEENRYQREYVSQQIDYYASVGSISEQEMQQLQREIAALDTAGRKAMLSKLTRAMNARQIEGQL